MEFAKETLQNNELKAWTLLLDFFREMDRKVESYIETLEVMSNPEPMKSIRRELSGK